MGKGRRKGVGKGRRKGVGKGRRKGVGKGRRKGVGKGGEERCGMNTDVMCAAKPHPQNRGLTFWIVNNFQFPHTKGRFSPVFDSCKCPSSKCCIRTSEQIMHS